MKCLINPKLFCGDQMKTGGSGKWNYRTDICQKCETFLKSGQTIMELYKKMPKKHEPENWITQKREQLKKERQAKMKERGMEILFNMPIGETEITIDTSIPPRTAETKFGARDVLRITVNDVEQDWMINPNSPLYRDLLEQLYEAKTHFIIVRSGLEKQTRYSIKKAW